MYLEHWGVPRLTFVVFATMLPAALAFWKGRAPWNWCSLAAGSLMLPFWILVGNVQSVSRSVFVEGWLAVLAIWLVCWGFAVTAMFKKRSFNRSSQSGSVDRSHLDEP